MGFFGVRFLGGFLLPTLPPGADHDHDPVLGPDLALRPGPHAGHGGGEVARRPPSAGRSLRLSLSAHSGPSNILDFD